MPPEIRTPADEPKKEPSHKSNVSVPLAIIGAGAMIAVAVYFGGTKLPSGTSATVTADTNITVNKVSDTDHFLGNTNAQIVVVEYSDLECPFCKTFHNTMHQVIDSYGGKVAWVYRQFPIAQLHPKALKEAEASECAAEQGGNTVFWDYIDKVFATTNSNNSLDPNQLGIIADSLHLDMTAFNSCLATGKYTKTISDNVSAAVAAGARGTPYSVIFVNGKLVDGDAGTLNGALPYEQVKAKIDALLD